MTTRRNSHLATCIAAAMVLAGAVPSASAGTFTSLHAFMGISDGANPWGNVIKVGGKLYGTTMGGGEYTWGTIFAMDAANGQTTLLHAFQETPDGGQPIAGLINVGGTLYGTTGDGGAKHAGTIFSFDLKTQTETVNYSFNFTHGRVPGATLINVGGILYGTTLYGGAGCNTGCGTVFSYNPATNQESVVYAFKGGTDGYEPAAKLLYLNGTLYGTTRYGGGAMGGPYQGGTVFAINIATGTETVLHYFPGGATDGAIPQAGLIDVKGILYGTTQWGGPATSACPAGCGAVFSINPRTGAEKPVYFFHGAPADGAQPIAPPLDVGGILYGTTSAGGANKSGALYALNLATSSESLAYSFAGNDGAQPRDGLVTSGGVLYGTTYAGGANNFGTVFSYTP